MTAHRLGFTALAAVLLLPLASAAQTQEETDPVTVGETAQGELSLDMDTVKDRTGPKQGRRVITADVELARPYHQAGHEITRERQKQEWDCNAKRYRIVLRQYFTSNGQYVDSRLGYSDWKSVPKEGPERTAFETLCGK